MRRGKPLPPDIRDRLSSLGRALEDCPSIVFAYLFGSAARNELTELSDADVAIFLEEDADSLEERGEIAARITRHLGTDSVDVVVLNGAPTALVGRLLQDRTVILDRVPFLRHRFESERLRHFYDFRILEHGTLERRFGSG